MTKWSYAHDAFEVVKRELEWEEPTEEELPLIAMYALLVLTSGAKTTAEQVHDAWSVWIAVYRNQPDHPSLVPFCELSDEVRALDDRYVDAIREAAECLL